MQSVCREINNFIQSISQRELERNPKLKQDIKNLLKSLAGLRTNAKDEKGVLKYLNRNMLISK